MPGYELIGAKYPRGKWGTQPNIKWPHAFESLNYKIEDSEENIVINESKNLHNMYTLLHFFGCNKVSYDW